MMIRESCEPSHSDGGSHSPSSEGPITLSHLKEVRALVRRHSEKVKILKSEHQSREEYLLAQVDSLQSALARSKSSRDLAACEAERLRLQVSALESQLAEKVPARSDLGERL